MRLFQICSNPSQLYKTYQGTPGKLVALDELLREFIDRREEKVVVWSFFRHSLTTILDRYSRYMPVRVDGSVADPRARAEAVSQFQENSQVRLFIGNPAAAGRSEEHTSELQSRR